MMKSIEELVKIIRNGSGAEVQDAIAKLQEMYYKQLVEKYTEEIKKYFYKEEDDEVY